ncbi:hypothetical protein [Hymenobacter edaphi]|uniref:hypothetical protein n=1 Tax=Hymenobacter edaphi TaxID=2211146 RepID=UPI001057AD9C|nr:hypothetical protein [Hymenobacter edaphi]
MKKILIVLLAVCCTSLQSCDDDDNKQVEVADTNIEGLFLGVVGFNNDVYVTGISNNITATNTAIDKLENNVDQTALCYGISKGIEQLTQFNSSQALDQAFIVAFTDGYDNYSGRYFPSVGQGAVVTHTQTLLRNASISGKPIKTYTIGLAGAGTLVDSDLNSLAVNGQYLRATSSTLQNTFQSIAKSLISTASNISILTSNTAINANDPKYLQITFNTYADPAFNGAMTPYTIYAQFINPGGTAPGFRVTSPKVNHISFIGDTGALITGSIQGSKYVVPLANLSINSPSSGQNLFIKDVVVANKFGTRPYTVDVEDSEAKKAIDKNVAVVLVLDCSTSLGTDFTPMKRYSKEFIQTLVDSKK